MLSVVSCTVCTCRSCFRPYAFVQVRADHLYEFVCVKCGYILEEGLQLSLAYLMSCHLGLLSCEFQYMLAASPDVPDNDRGLMENSSLSPLTFIALESGV